MNITRELDLAIKKAENGTGDYRHTQTQKTYDTYLSNSAWADLYNDMKNKHASAFKEYGAGGGGELTEKKNFPPKMASYGSSSRMIYTLLRETGDFHFEKKLPTSVGNGTANLDGFCERDDRYIFVEAKCHEPYSPHEVTDVSLAYEPLYEHLNRSMQGSLTACYTHVKKRKTKKIKDKKEEVEVEELRVCFDAKAERIGHFDIKQMICHLLGIGTGVLTGQFEKTEVNLCKPIEFIYLLYDPSHLPLSGEAREKIMEIYARTRREFDAIDFSRLYREILFFLFDKLKAQGRKLTVSRSELSGLAASISFRPVSQEYFQAKK